MFFSPLEKKHCLLASSEMGSAVRTLLTLLAPFAPHISAELWQFLPNLSQSSSVHHQSWPSFQASSTVVSNASVIVQVNGRYKGTLIYYCKCFQQPCRKRSYSNHFHRRSPWFARTAAPARSSRGWFHRFRKAFSWPSKFNIAREKAKSHN